MSESADLLLRNPAAVAAFGVGVLLAKLWGRPKLNTLPKCVLVTGAGAGLGKATATLLLRKGDTVVGVDVNAEALEKMEAEWKGQFLSLPCNVGDADSVRDAAARLGKFQGTSKCLDCIINFAGILRGGPLVEMSDADMATSLNVNVLGTFLVNKHFFALMKADSPNYSARIINVSSEIAYCGLSAAFNAPYAMSKAAVWAYSTALRQELSALERPIKVLTLVPGAFATDMTDHGTLAFEKAAAKPNTLYKAALVEGGEFAALYMALAKVPATYMAEQMFHAVHTSEPESEVLFVNMSVLMALIQFAPQPLLDFLFWARFGASLVPFLNTWNVGTAEIELRCASSWFSSMSTLQKVMCGFFCASASIMGAMAWQGPHHDAV
jgi:NAD(P)-dependent dehydrogenase (short-subunit alcohol dehydrogenase family)